MTDFVLFGALANALLVVLGALVGMIFHGIVHRKGKNLPQGENAEESNGMGKRISDAIFKGIGLCVILIGLDGAIKGAVNGQISDALAESGVRLGEICSERTLVIIISMVVGVIVGELLDLDKRINLLGDQIQRMMKGRGGNVGAPFCKRAPPHPPKKAFKQKEGCANNAHPFCVIWILQTLRLLANRMGAHPR